uniref:phosphate/phosphite/phosphonate ABC transporter substrate-binding protein n=1 Tax=Ideonella sp. A 288 TaxID=1962181 RepID=UPI000B4BD288
ACAAPAPAAAQAPADDTLVVGVLPNIGATALMAQYEHFKRYFERNGHKVRIVLPANFKAFFDGTMKGEYDLAVAAPHFARTAQLDRNMVPLAMYEPRINALFVAPIDTTIASVRDVRERSVAFANPQSLVAMYGQQWLRQNKLEPGKDYEVKGARTDLGVGRMLLSGDAVAAIMSNGEFRALPPDESARLKVVEVFARIPNFIILAHPRLERTRVARLKTQLKDFLSDAEDGSAFARATGFTGIVDIDEAQLKELDPYVAQTRKAMGYAN